jgi:ATP-dependent helicase/nuclease subunit A
VKQAVFTWRAGDPRLFREIYAHYNRNGVSKIEEERLDQSHRSGPAVIAMVNRVLGDAATLRSLCPPDAARRWSEEWRNHTTAHPDRVDFAELRSAADQAGRFAEAQRLIEETGALRRGLSVAVLVQKNQTATDLADYLRRSGGLPAIAESDLHVGVDNPLTAGAACTAACGGASRRRRRLGARAHDAACRDADGRRLRRSGDAHAAPAG